jgi:hypothetical protein
VPVVVTYYRGADLARDAQGQFAQGGLLLRLEPNDALAPFCTVQVAIEAPGGRAVVDAEVLQVLPGLGVAVSFNAEDENLRGVIENSAKVADKADKDPGFEWVDKLEATTSRGGKDRDKAGSRENAFLRVKNATVQEKVHMAKHGTKSERAAILRDNNKLLHQYVIRNPNIQLDEVIGIARMPTISVDVLKSIAEKREWYQRPELASALVRNPRTPVPIAVKVLRYVGRNDLRQIAKGTNVRSAISSAARKLLLAR